MKKKENKNDVRITVETNRDGILKTQVIQTSGAVIAVCHDKVEFCDVLVIGKSVSILTAAAFLDHELAYGLEKTMPELLENYRSTCEKGGKKIRVLYPPEETV